MLENYIPQIEEKLTTLCEDYVNKGLTPERIVFSPRWINIYDAYENEGKYYFIFKSTNSYSKFLLEVSKETFENYDTTVLWKEFKAIRTEFLIKNFPTINAY